MLEKTVKTRILIMSDTHEGYQRSLSRSEPWSPDGSFRPPMPKADILIHSGDLTMIGTMDEYRGAIDMLSSIDAELKLVIAGNHDLSLHHDYYLNGIHAKRIARHNYNPAFADEARELWTGEAAKKAGVTYLTEGLYDFRLKNGAYFSVYASPWQPVFCDWAFNYPLSEDRWNPEHLIQQIPDIVPNVKPAAQSSDPHPIPEGAKVDIMITHGPPYGHLDRTSGGVKAGCPHLLAALYRVRPRLHCFGHIHEAWGAEVVKWRTGSAQKGTDGRLGETSEILGAWQEYRRDCQRPSQQDAIERRANFLDVSKEGKRPLEAGNETLLINSCIMDLGYDANGSAWLVDMDLPLKQN